MRDQSVYRLSKHQFWFVKRQDLRMMIEYFQKPACAGTTDTDHVDVVGV